MIGMKLWFLLPVFLSATQAGFTQQVESGPHRYFNNFEDSVSNLSWMNPATITVDSLHNHFSRTDGNKPYSAGIEIEIPLELRRKNFMISVSGLTRFNEGSNRGQLVMSIASGDSAIFWKGERMPDTTANVWTLFRTSALIPRNIAEGSRIKIFIWNSAGTEIIDVDEVEIVFSEIEFPSFLPDNL